MNRFLQFLMFFSHVLWLHLPSSLLYLSFSQNVVARLSLDLSEFCSSCFPLACFSLSLGLWSVNVCHIFRLKRHLFDYKSKLYTSHKWWCLVHIILCDKFECGSAVPRCLPPDHQNPTEARSFREIETHGSWINWARSNTFCWRNILALFVGSWGGFLESFDVSLLLTWTNIWSCSNYFLNL